MNTELEETIRPLIECELSLSQQKMALNQMYAMAVSNAPEDETENYTARKLTPAFLALCQLLENVKDIS